MASQASARPTIAASSGIASPRGVRIAAAVPALVVMADQRHASRRRPSLPTISAPFSECSLISAYSARVELGRLRQDRVGDGELADVVEERTVAAGRSCGRCPGRARRPIASAIRCDATEWPAVYRSLASTATFSASIASSELCSSSGTSRAAARSLLQLLGLAPHPARGAAHEEGKRGVEKRKTPSTISQSAGCARR